MQINLLSNKKGVITTRQAEIVSGEWKVTFLQAPDNASAIFKNSKNNELYRLLADERVTVQQIGDSKNLLISPCDMDIPSRLAQIEVTLDGFVRTVASLKEQNANLKAELEKLIEGYDID